MGRSQHPDHHFFTRLEQRGNAEQTEYFLALYKDHEFVRYLLSHLKLPPEADRVALAGVEKGPGPHAIVARDGGWVTYLDAGMSTGRCPIVSRAQVRALADKHEDVRQGLELARKRGLDARRAVERLESAGPALSREDFKSIHALLGEATTVLMGTYAGCVESVKGTMPYLMQRDLEARLRRDWTREIAASTWGLAHSALMHVDNAPREWVEHWAELPAHATGSPFTWLLQAMQVPFFARAAWLAGRLGKPFFAHYKKRYCEGSDDGFNLLEAAWGLVAMGLRHASLRADAARALQAAPARSSEHEFVRTVRENLAGLAEILGTDEEAQVLELAQEVGRKEVLAQTAHLEPGSPYAFREVTDVPEALALAVYLEAPFEALDLRNGLALTAAAVVACARGKAEDFYLPAQYLRARRGPDIDASGESLVQVHRSVVMSDSTVRREGPRVGRNDPCPCGSGKKHKKCCG